MFNIHIQLFNNIYNINMNMIVTNYGLIQI